MSRPVWKWLLAMSLALNVGIAAIVAWQTWIAAPAPAVAGAERINLPDRLTLNGEQRKQWQQLEEGFLHDLSANWREIRLHRDALVRQIFSSQPDRAEIDRLQARISSLQDAQQRRVIRQLLAERELLDDAQRKALGALLLERYSQETSEEEALHRQ